MNIQNLQQENGTLLMTKMMDNMVEEMKMIQSLNLKQKSLNQVFVTGDIKIAGIAADTSVAFKNCAPFTRYVTHINDEHVETAENYNYVHVQFN